MHKPLPLPLTFSLSKSQRGHYTVEETKTFSNGRGRKSSEYHKVEMASIKAKLVELTKCSICLETFTDPRMLPCIHSFCRHCLEQIQKNARKRPGERMPCPLCKTAFIIPPNGVVGLKKNIYIQDILDLKEFANTRNNTTDCDICRSKSQDEDQEVSAATIRCLQCQENLCDVCSDVHKFQRLTKLHQIIQLGKDDGNDSSKIFHVKYCQTHEDKPLDYYCTQCKKIVCVSCFVGSHSKHDCKDVKEVEKDFRSRIKAAVEKLANYSTELSSKRSSLKQKRTELLQIVGEKEKLVQQRSQEIKDLIDRHTKSLLDKLSSAKEEHLKTLDNEMDEIETDEAILQNFETYCTELASKGAPGHVCDCFEDIVKRADELEKENNIVLGRPNCKVKVDFKANDISKTVDFSRENCIGIIEVQTTRVENFAVVVGMSDGSKTTGDVLKINLHRSGDVQHLPDIPTSMRRKASAVVNNNTIYVTGIGMNANEIWKCDFNSGWKRCANLVQGRRRHSVAFVNDVLYICGGYVDADKNVLDSIESYFAFIDNCTTVGKLVHACESSANCVSYKKSLYIFGGRDRDGKAMQHVQMYNTENNTCSLLKHPMPLSCYRMRAALWKDSVILLSQQTCVVYNFETKAWLSRQQFKTDVMHFCLALDNDRIFVIGGGSSENDSNGKKKWKCRDDVRYVSITNIIQDKPMEWKEHAKLPKPCLVHACGMMSLTQQEQLDHT